MKLFSKKIKKTKEIYKVVALGNTGVGKSSLLNMLGNTNEFQVGEDAHSHTKDVESKVKYFLGDSNEIQLCLIDTQGLYDPSGDQRDMENIRDMVTTIRRHKSINMFLYCVEESNPRFTTYIQDTITLFDNIFPNFLDHALLVFNKAKLKHVKNRESLVNQWNDRFTQVFGLPADKQVKCIFLDSNVPSDKQKFHDDQIEKFKNILISKRTRCDVLHIEPKSTLRVKLKETMMRLRQELEENRKIIEEREKYFMEKEAKRVKWKRNLIIAGGSSGGALSLIIILAIVF